MSPPRRAALAILGLALGLAGAVAVASAPATGMPRSPEAAAQSLYKAWKAHARKAARRVATPGAVAKLFGARAQAMSFRGCHVREGEGGFECIFVEPSLDLSLAMIVDGGASAGGYNVTSLGFSSEE